MGHSALRLGPQRYPLESAVALQPIEKIVLENAPARSALLAAQVSQVFVAEPRLAHPIDKPLQTRANAIPCLVSAVIRVRSEEMVELHLLLVHPHAEINLRHRQLV